MSSNKQSNRKRRQRGRSLSISHNNRASRNSLKLIDLTPSNSTNHRITNQYQF